MGILNYLFNVYIVFFGSLNYSYVKKEILLYEII